MQIFIKLFPVTLIYFNVFHKIDVLLLPDLLGHSGRMQGIFQNVQMPLKLLLPFLLCTKTKKKRTNLKV